MEIDKDVQAIINEAGKCTWQAWQEGRKYSCDTECDYGDLMDYSTAEQEKIIAAGFTDPDQTLVTFPAGAIFTVKQLHGPGGGWPVIEFDKLPGIEFDIALEDFDDTLYKIEESKSVANVSDVKDIFRVIEQAIDTAMLYDRYGIEVTGFSPEMGHSHPAAPSTGYGMVLTTPEGKNFIVKVWQE